MANRKRFWHSEDVRCFCISRNLYTKGDCESYSRMLDYVREHELPTMEDVEKVVTDILFHSEGYGTIFNDWNNYVGYRELRNELVQETTCWIDVEEI